MATEARCSSRKRTMRSWPIWAAIHSAVVPSARRASIRDLHRSVPTCSRMAPTTRSWPFCAAKNRHVAPSCRPTIDHLQYPRYRLVFLNFAALVLIVTQCNERPLQIVRQKVEWIRRFIRNAHVLMALLSAFQLSFGANQVNQLDGTGIVSIALQCTEPLTGRH